MRHKTIRGAVAGAMLVTFVLGAAPVAAGSARPLARPRLAPDSASCQSGTRYLAWAGALLEALDPRFGLAGLGKLLEVTGSVPGVSAPTSPIDGGGMNPSRSSGIDPMG